MDEPFIILLYHFFVFYVSFLNWITYSFFIIKSIVYFVDFKTHLNLNYLIFILLSHFFVFYLSFFSWITFSFFIIKSIVNFVDFEIHLNLNYLIFILLYQFFVLYVSFLFNWITYSFFIIKIPLPLIFILILDSLLIFYLFSNFYY